MSDLASVLSRMLQHAKEYMDVRVELFKLEAVERNAQIASAAIAAVIISLAAVFAVVLLSVAAAFWLGTLWGATYLGFLAMGGFYLCIAVLLFLNRIKWIKERIQNAIVGQYFKGKQDEQ
ncbi:MAG: phage holin family protein [Chitinophagales bacterium]